MNLPELLSVFFFGCIIGCFISYTMIWKLVNKKVVVEDNEDWWKKGKKPPWEQDFDPY